MNSTTRFLARLLLLALGLLLGLLALEIGLRFYFASGAIPSAHLENQCPEEFSGVVEDAEAGYLPLRGGKADYDQYGCLTHEYDVKTRRGQRLLFVGDSVTRRGKIMEALREIYGDRDYEYWNAGVESFNTYQEWVWYQRYNSQIEPDHVILTFHNNDFRATPLMVRERGEVRIYLPGMSIHPWLFEKSYLYRWAWPHTDDSKARAQAVYRGLEGFRDHLQGRGARFSVLLFPMLKPLADWDRQELESRELSKTYFQELGLSWFDLLEISQTALQAGLEVTQSPGDIYHPNQAIAQSFAQYLKSQRLLEGD